MTFTQKGQWPTDLAAKMKIGMSAAVPLVGKALVRRAQAGIRAGKSGNTYETNFFTIGSGAGRRIVAYGSRPAHTASAPGEYSANDKGDLAASINFQPAANGLKFYATSAHAGYQEFGTDKFSGRKNLERAILESDGEIQTILTQIISKALGV